MADSVPSKQRRYQLRLQKKKLCPKCGEKTGGFFYCKTHREQDAKIKKQVRLTAKLAA